jgi:hypothetical protein
MRWRRWQLCLCREPVLDERECAAGGGRLRGGTVRTGYCTLDHRDDEKHVVDGQVTPEGACRLGGSEGLLDEFGNPLSTPLERGA